MTKIGRNEPCPCGRGKKYKRCHGGPLAAASVQAPKKHRRRVHETCATRGNNVELFLKMHGPFGQMFAKRIRAEKKAGTRPVPSSRLLAIDAPAYAPALLDHVAGLVDENVFGRHEMCLQFAALLERALLAMGVPAEARVGRVKYAGEGGAAFEWAHAWVVVAHDVLVDGNTDSMHENSVVPPGIDPSPYWGPLSSLPADRSFPKGRPLPGRERNDEDVLMWWDDLRDWLEGESLLAS